ncbi:MAG: type II toxin-antitoxin system prevent-host-death family antitoxin [Caldilinea sp. CFX5]|nr:type II toxin-antitoxin system prevent-host-death family antitoxin [Caldilinea sp. CFX5]
MIEKTSATNLQVGVKELKDNLSAYLRQVKTGVTVTITEHGQPIGRLTPVQKSTEERLQELVNSGLIVWNGKKYQPDANRLRPRLSPNAPKTAAEVVLEDRD